MAHILPEPPRTRDYRMASPPPQCPHGTAYAQPCYSCGWTCPACKRSYAPWVRECNYRHEEDSTPSTPPVLPPWCADPGALSLRLPPEMAQQGRYRAIHLKNRDEWAEAFPGLQCRYYTADRAEDGTYLEFRLTPQEAGSDSPA